MAVNLFQRINELVNNELTIKNKIWLQNACA